MSNIYIYAQNSSKLIKRGIKMCKMFGACCGLMISDVATKVPIHAYFSTNLKPISI
jgi:hypothetical protein